MNFAVLQFPASNCDQDALHVVKGVLGHAGRFVWHKENSLAGFDAVIIPGGFSYGDYLRTGAIARFSPIMQSVQQFAANGGPVLGICNGFQILCEAQLLPGALVRNRSLQFRCEHILMRTATADSPFSNKIPPGKIMRVPIAHGEGCYFAEDIVLEKLRNNAQILFQYCDSAGELTELSNPNGSLLNIAGICNEARNVAGLMPHPERASESVLGCDDGRLVFESMVSWMENRLAKAA
jgi:phosphoribosylformylglycinamidine synthase